MYKLGMKIMFNYDPVKVEIIKAAPDGRTYSRKTKTWDVHETIDNMNYLLVHKRELELDDGLVIDIEILLDELSAPVKTDGVFSNVDWRCKPYDHQKKGLELILNNESIALFWEQGVGKTLPTIKAIEERMKK